MAINKELHEHNLKEANLNKDLDKRKYQDSLTQQFKNEIQQQQQAEALDRAAYYEDLRIKAAPVWDEVVKKGKSFYTEGFKGYETWESAMSDIVAFNLLFATALRHQNPVIFGTIFDIPGNIARAVLPVSVPTIEYDIGLIDLKGKNRLEIKHLSRNDGKQLTPEQILEFQAGVVDWLDKRGYEPDNTPASEGVFLPKNGKPVLTPDILKELLIEPGKGLSAYLSDLREHNHGCYTTPRP